MAIPIYIVKRRLKRKRRNGERHYRYSLQWRESDPTTGKMKLKCETTGTADMTEARELQKLKWGGSQLLNRATGVRRTSGHHRLVDGMPRGAQACDGSRQPSTILRGRFALDATRCKKRFPPRAAPLT